MAINESSSAESLALIRARRLITKLEAEIAMLQLSENDHDTQCHAKAKGRGQRTFTLVEQDTTAVKTIAHWIYLNIETAPEAKLERALHSCLLMRQFTDKKNAD